ncbi:MAG: hypothetical protein ACE5DI_06335 [Candidatus Micrarchaeia archaeon]
MSSKSLDKILSGRLNAHLQVLKENEKIEGKKEYAKFLCLHLKKRVRFQELDLDLCLLEECGVLKVCNGGFNRKVFKLNNAQEGKKVK